MHIEVKVTKLEKLINKVIRAYRKAVTPRPIVNFFIAGTQKGGTTALHDFLVQHPEICMPQHLKEIHFFDNDRFFKDLYAFLPAYDKYHSYFSPSNQTKLIGEACPCYMWSDKAPARIFEYNPNAKIILLLRNPIKRAYSHWNMAVARKTETRSFLEAINSEVETARNILISSSSKEFISDQNRTFSYLSRGFYSSQIRRILRYFPKHNLLCLLSEDLHKKHDETLIKIFDFLDVSSDIKVPRAEIHRRQYLKSMEPSELKILKNYFEPEIQSLELIIGRDLSQWLDS